MALRRSLPLFALLLASPARSEPLSDPADEEVRQALRVRDYRAERHAQQLLQPAEHLSSAPTSASAPAASTANTSECDAFRRALGRATWAVLHRASAEDDPDTVSALINHTRVHYPCEECRGHFADFCGSCRHRREATMRFLVKAHMNANLHAGHGADARAQAQELLAMDDSALRRTLGARPLLPRSDDPQIASWVEELQQIRQLATGRPLQTQIVWRLCGAQ